MTTSSVSRLDSAQAIDDHLSQRPLQLDPAGYFIIYVDRDHALIYAKHFSTVINEQGLATDPLTGKVIPAKGKLNRPPERIFSGRTAKEICVELFENPDHEGIVSQFSHAAYLGRELQRAETALWQGSEYVQD
ncbi:MAG: DUF4346 domain-containing protein [Cyanobacteriota bacterium]|nr:DUF4346 domain-containing protein [Cyanobacteriota bacterium]